MGYTIWPDGSIGEALRDVYNERLRQEQLKADGRFKYTCADREPTNVEKFAILGEEIGEVARVVVEMGGLANDVHGKNLKKELIQVAAVCIAWIESLD